MRLNVSNFLMFLLVLLMLIQPVQAKAYVAESDVAALCTNATQKFEQKYQIKEHLLTTISSVETGRWNPKLKRNTAWPWTINAQGKGRFFATKAEAIREAKRLIASGVKSFDVGCMQINMLYHGDAFANIEEAFEPEKNVEYGAKFLKNLYSSRGKDWMKAAMAYHSSVPSKAQRYKKRIVSAYEVVKQAQNSKTASARLFAENSRPAPVKAAAENPARKSALAVKNAIDRNRKAIAANQWREAKLAEYRLSKNN